MNPLVKQPNRLCSLHSLEHYHEIKILTTWRIHSSILSGAGHFMLESMLEAFMMTFLEEGMVLERRAGGMYPTLPRVRRRLRVGSGLRELRGGTAFARVSREARGPGGINPAFR